MQRIAREARKREPVTVMVTLRQKTELEEEMRRSGYKYLSDYVRREKLQLKD
jgi:hypothetical protein